MEVKNTHYFKETFCNLWNEQIYYSNNVIKFYTAESQLSELNGGYTMEYHNRVQIPDIFSNPTSMGSPSGRKLKGVCFRH